MEDMFTKLWGTEAPVEPGVSAQPVRAAAAVPVLKRAEPIRDGAVLRPFVNFESNSRIPYMLRPGHSTAALKFRIDWQAQLFESFQPICILVRGDRLIAQGEFAWQLMDRTGLIVATGPLRHSDVTIDPAMPVFYAADMVGDLVALNLSDGKEDFRIPLSFGEIYRRSFVARYKERLVTVGSETPLHPEAPDPTTCGIEVADLSDLNMDPLLGTRKSEVPSGLLINSTLLLSAVHGDAVTLASHQGVYVLSFDLRFQKILTGPFMPLSMSLDEEGRIYLLVKAEERTALWLLKDNGELLYSFELPREFGELSAPPVVGYDHTAYLVSPQQILAVKSSGKLSWSESVPEGIAGAVVTADDALLVSAGKGIIAFDATGKKYLLHAFSDEPLKTPPVLMENGGILVASPTKVYFLKRDDTAK